MATAVLTAQRVGRFRLVEELGRGSTGSVFLATQVGAGGREVALKVLDSGITSRPGFRERLERDIRAVSALSHPHILPVYEYGSAGELSYLVMPLVRGGTLRERLRNGPLPTEAAWRVLRQVGEALHRAHQVGVVHSDVKPGNVLFDVYGRVLLSDFGLARTHFGFARGTPGYMAPEQALGDEVDRRADVYALAVLTFEMLTGTRLFLAETPAELLQATVHAPLPAAQDRCPGVPAGLDAALLRGLARSPERRYGSTMELLWALAPVLEGRSRRRRPRSPLRRPGREEVGFVPSVLVGEADGAPEGAPGGDGRLEEVEPSA